jgi:HAMP domain-containing protein
MTIRSKLLLFYGVMLGVILTVGAVSIRAIIRWRAAAEHLMLAREQSDRAERLRAGMYRQINSGLDFLDGEAESEDEFWRRDRIVAGHLEELKRHAQSQEEVDHIEGLEETRYELTWTAKRIFESVHNSTKGFDLSRAHSRLREIADEVTDDVAALNQFYREQVDRSITAASHAGSFAGMVIAGAVFAALLQLLTLIFLTQRWLVRPIGSVSRATKVISSGDFDVQIPLATGDEWGKIARSINDMAKSLKTLQQQLRLQSGNILSGYVYDSLGVGIPDIDLNVYDQATGTKLNTPGDNTDATGFYDVVVPSGTFRLRWRSVAGDPLVPVEIENVVITNDTTINITMQTGVYVSGTVQDQLLNPVFDADLDFTDSNTGIKVFTPGDNTDASGFYQVLVVPGIYDIEVAPQVADRLVAVKILAVPVNIDTTINFTLVPGFSLSGTVKDINGVGVFNADLDVKYTTTGFKVVTPSDNTDTLGNYEVIVPSGLFDIFYKPPVATRLAPVMIDSASITNDTIINVTVHPGVLLSGTVRNGAGFGIVGVDIDATEVLTGLDVPLAGDHTDSLGVFGTVVVPGTYHIDIEPPKTRRLAAQRLLNLSLSQDTSIVVVLDTGVSVSGFVTDSTGTPVADADVSAIISANGDTVFTPGDNTDTIGYYEIIIPPNTYHLVYAPDSLSGIADTVHLYNVNISRDTIINVALSGSLPACCQGIRGNVNGDGGDQVNVADLTYLVDFLFRAGSPPPCQEESNVNGDLAENVNVADLTYLVDFLFRSGSPPPSCP